MSIGHFSEEMNMGNFFEDMNIGNFFGRRLWDFFLRKQTRETFFKVVVVSQAVSIEILLKNDTLNLKSVFVHIV